MELDVVIHHPEIGSRLKPLYRVDDVRELLAFLRGHPTLNMTPLPTGLYPAAGGDPQAAARTGYSNVWVRDNVYVALAQQASGRLEAACAAVQQLAAFYLRYRGRFEAILDGRVDLSSPMNRPAVRFDGLAFAELPEQWPHAQNDALGLPVRGSWHRTRSSLLCCRFISRPSGIGRTRTAGIGKSAVRLKRPVSVPSLRDCASCGCY
jgi:Glycosyl hydrolases family 15